MNLLFALADQIKQMIPRICILHLGELEEIDTFLEGIEKFLTLSRFRILLVSWASSMRIVSSSATTLLPLRIVTLRKLLMNSPLQRCEVWFG